MKTKLLELAKQMENPVNHNSGWRYAWAKQLRALAARQCGEMTDAVQAESPETMTPRQLAKRLAKGERWELAPKPEPMKADALSALRELATKWLSETEEIEASFENRNVYMPDSIFFANSAREVCVDELTTIIDQYAPSAPEDAP